MTASTWARAGSCYDGRLFLRTVAPSAHTARRIGGTGYQWHVNGADYRPAVNAGAPRESGAWRIEIHPRAPAARHHMVHALLVAEPSVFNAPATEEPHVPAGWRAAHVAAAPEVALVIAEDRRGALPLGYELTTALPCVHVIVGLEPHTAFAVRSGDRTGTLPSSAEGILAIEDPEIGPHTVTLSLSAAP